MRYSMIRVREPELNETPETQVVTLNDLLREIACVQIDSSRYAGGLSKAAFELEVERTVLAQIACALLDGKPLSFGSRMLLEDEPLEGAAWRLAEGTQVDLSDDGELWNKARVVQRVRRACRMRMAS